MGATIVSAKRELLIQIESENQNHQPVLGIGNVRRVFQSLRRPIWSAPHLPCLFHPPIIQAEYTIYQGQNMARPKKEIQQEPLEKQLWSAADKLRKNIDAAEYKHVVLGLIFLKYISDSFESLFVRLQEGKGEFEGADPEDRDEYTAKNVFSCPSPPAGTGCATMPKNRKSAFWLTPPWTPLNRKIPRSRAFCPRCTPRRIWIPPALAH